MPPVLPSWTMPVTLSFITMIWAGSNKTTGMASTVPLLSAMRFPPGSIPAAGRIRPKYRGIRYTSAVPAGLRWRWAWLAPGLTHDVLLGD